MTVHLYIPSHTAVHVMALVMAMFLLRFDRGQSLFSKAPERTHDPICNEMVSLRGRFHRPMPIFTLRGKLASISMLPPESDEVIFLLSFWFLCVIQFQKCKHSSR